MQGQLKHSQQQGRWMGGSRGQLAAGVQVANIEGVWGRGHLAFQSHASEKLEVLHQMRGQLQLKHSQQHYEQGQQAEATQNQQQDQLRWDVARSWARQGFAPPWSLRLQLSQIA